MRRVKLISTVLLILSLLFLFNGCNENECDDCDAHKTPVKDGIFIHISHGPEDAHRVLMALNMANLMSETKDVLVYFDIKGVNVVFKDAPDIEFSHFPTSHAAIKTLLDKGITVYACPGCIKAAGRTPEDLMPGIQVADKDGFFNFTKGRILTIDY